MHRSRNVLALAAMLSACASPTPTPVSAPQVQELRHFERLQDVFRNQYTGRQTIDFVAAGRVTVLEAALDGYPGNAYVRCRFQYQNRTARPVVQAWVSLDVLDANGDVINTRTSCLILPTATAIQRGSYFVDELRTPTLDAHKLEGWSWRLRCDAQLETADEPLDPPAAEWAPRASEPFIRRSR